MKKTNFRAKLSWCHFEVCADGPWHRACTSWSVVDCQKAQTSATKRRWQRAVTARHVEFRHGEAREWKAWTRPGLGRQTDDLQSGWHTKCWLGALLYCRMFTSLPWFASLARVSLCDHAKRRKARWPLKRRRLVIPIWAVSARARVLGHLFVPPRTPVLV